MSDVMKLFEIKPPVDDPSYPHPVYDGGRRFYGQTKRIGSWPIEQGDVVADIGCGHTPFPYAGILVDRSQDDGSERFGKVIPSDGRAIVEADIENGLPFGYKSLDFSYCSHLLEHLHNPMKGCDELKRVSKKGFIEVPNVHYEIFWGTGMQPRVHRWIASTKGGTIKFFRYDGREDALRVMNTNASMKEKTDFIFSEVFKRKPYDDDKEAYTRRYIEAYWKNPELFTDIMLWEDGFDVFVEEPVKSHAVTA
jgi:SAM-dependent methyltransferase